VLKSAQEEVQTVVDDVRAEWRVLWRERIDDRVRAEGLASQDFSLLFVERGTVIVATRDFKLLDLKEILRLHEIEDAELFVSPHPSVGGWGRFIRTVIRQQSRATQWKETAPVRPRRAGRKKNLQLKKCGRGWLHRSADR
jgi:hypothetical protein